MIYLEKLTINELEENGIVVPDEKNKEAMELYVKIFNKTLTEKLCEETDFDKERAIRTYEQFCEAIILLKENGLYKEEDEDFEKDLFYLFEKNNR